MAASQHPAVAIIGMSGRFPDAADLQAFWSNLERGLESLVSFSSEELLASGVEPSLLQHPNYVPKGTYLEDADRFAAGFFGFNPREAEILDPQQRIFLECAWEALEDAGYAGDAHGASTGVYAGASMNSYLLNNLLRNPEAIATAGGYQVMVGNDKDFLATRVSYKLNLKGPSVTIQTACSTSLVAVQSAFQALLSHQCDVALAGGVSLHFPQKVGHLYSEGMILSADGRCLPFDAAATGIRAGDGAGIVVLKRLEDALRDGDSIRAVIRGAAINNDGAAKMGYTAPSVEGQAEAISSALRMSGVDAATVSYVEAHGTGTRVGDPIEIAALERAFRAHTEKKQFCAIGSVKSNIGHLDAAAGIAGLIKTVLSLEHKRLVPVAGFEQPNPLIDFANSPFYVSQEAAEWVSEDGAPRRAGVSSFGIGGTNAHVVLEEAPPQPEPVVRWPAQLVVLSAGSEKALDAVTERIAGHLAAHPKTSFADICFTLQAGRKALPHRIAVVAPSREGAIKALAPERRRNLDGGVVNGSARPVTFMFSGQGSQHTGMARDLYQAQPTFRRYMDECSSHLKDDLGLDLCDLLYSAPGEANRLNETRFAQPALFAVEYSLARMWMSWGIQPESMIGHSIGEYVAACLAGVFTLADALRVVAARGRMMQQMPPGGMLAVHLPPERAARFVTGEICLAAVNTPSLCSLSGPLPAIGELQARLEGSGIDCSRLHTSHAFHSGMMDDCLASFRACLEATVLSKPALPFVSNLTGDWIRPEEATDPAYWSQHLRQTVQFAGGLRRIAEASEHIFLEVGPGRALTLFARECTREIPGGDSLASLPHPKDQDQDSLSVLNTAGKLWLGGIDLDWAALHEGESLHRVPLPTYPFERQRFWVQPQSGAAPAAKPESLRKAAFSQWFYTPTWSRSAFHPVRENPGPWLIFAGPGDFSGRLSAAVSKKGQRCTIVESGPGYALRPDGTYTINPRQPEDYQRLLATLRSAGAFPRAVAYLWGLPDAVDGGSRTAFHGLYSLAQAFGNLQLGAECDWLVVTAGLHAINGRDRLSPEPALLLGPCNAIPREYPSIRCRSIDLEAGDPSAETIEKLLLEATLEATSRKTAYRDGYRWEQTWAPVLLRTPESEPIRKGGVYLITGGLGGLGLALAGYIAQAAPVHLALIGRSPLPAPSDWQAWLDSHPETDEVSRRILEIRRLEAHGAEIMPLAADVCDRASMQSALEEIHRRFGPVNGVIHAAGIVDPSLVQLRTAEAADRVLAAKLEGTLILDSLLEKEPLDFFVLFSSISAIARFAGTADYSAANAFLDAFANSRFNGKRAVVSSINWDFWQDSGMALKEATRRLSSESERQQFMEFGIRSSDGIEAFRRVVASGLPQVAVVARDLRSVLEESDTPAEDRADERGAPAAEASGSSMHDRPDLRTVYVPAETEVQKRMAGIWSSQLGIEQIGIDDNFFELGGHSLLATGVLSRVRDAFGVNMPLRTVFEAPTIRSLSEVVTTLLWAASPAAADATDSGDREEVEL